MLVDGILSIFWAVRYVLHIEFYYDPVRPETLISIDGVSIARTDIYSFLYPVRGYILQTWLPESGSWNGLFRELQDITRDDPSELVFHGRKTDFQDLAAMIAPHAHISCSLLETDYVRVWMQRIQDAEQKWQHIVNRPVIIERGDPDITKAFAELFAAENDRISAISQSCDNEWLIRISSPEDIDKAMEGDACCLIDGDSMLSYGDQSLLDKLTGSLRRADDMLVCSFRTEEKMREYRAFSRLSGSRNMIFTITDDSSWLQGLSAKYGEPYLCRQRINRLKLIEQELSHCYLDAKQQPLAATRLETIRAALVEQHRQRWLLNRKKDIAELHELLYGVDYMTSS